MTTQCAWSKIKWRPQDLLKLGREKTFRITKQQNIKCGQGCEVFHIHIGYSSQNNSGENENFKHFDCVKLDEI